MRHHQKRVELAFRSNDRVKLIDAYLELGDALFRSGEERKARAVYQRVLELAPDDPRAQAAVESVALASPAAGSGAIPAIPPSAPERPQSGPRPPDKHVPYQSVPSNGARPTGGVTAPPPSRKPSPLDRSDATHGEFVDLGDWLRSGENPKSTRMVAEEKPPSGDEQADFQEMLKRFKQGVAENVDEEDYESHYDLGVAYKEMGLVDEAVAEFQKALRGSSNRVRAYEALGQCFVEKEQFHVAASVLSRAIALGEGDDHHLVGVLYLLGKATEALGKPNAALDYYQRVFAVDIEFRDVAERISAIEGKATSDRTSQQLTTACRHTPATFRPPSARGCAESLMRCGGSSPPTIHWSATSTPTCCWRRARWFARRCCCLSSHVDGASESRATALAAVAELIHLATLVHDDAVDHSVLRRGMPTINALFSHQVSVIMGDFLYSRALSELVRLGDMEPLAVFTAASNALTLGEMRQLAALDALAFSEDDYDALIESKTASLFAAACEVGCVVRSDAVSRRRSRAFGQRLGMAFQVADDLLDYTEAQETTGKPTGLDLREHKVTLPLIAALRTMSPVARRRVDALFADPSPEDAAIADVVEIVTGGRRLGVRPTSWGRVRAAG